MFYFDQCNEALAAGGAIKLIRDEGVDVIIGPACSSCKLTSPTELQKSRILGCSEPKNNDSGKNRKFSLRYLHFRTFGADSGKSTPTPRLESHQHRLQRSSDLGSAENPEILLTSNF